MRIRLRSLPPLPSFKAWFELPPYLVIEDDDIQALKREIQKRFLASTEEAVQVNQMILEIDEFELVDDSPLSVIRENDLVVVKYRPNAVAGTKRKRESETPSRALPKVPKQAAPPATTSSSSTSSKSSSSSSSSESSSSDSSDDSSSSTSKGSKSSTSSISISSDRRFPMLKKNEPELLALHKQFVIASQSFERKVEGFERDAEERRAAKGINTEPVLSIPPGQGKSSTKQRNSRRRKKRMAEKAQTKKDVSVSASAIAVSPPPSHALMPNISSTTFPQQSANDAGALRESMLKATKNDNKKKGFKQGMQGSTSKHQVFGDESTSIPNRSNGTRTRLVPPSERGDLPSNIVVTSVDVEAGKWDSGNSKRSKVSENIWSAVGLRYDDGHGKYEVVSDDSSTSHETSLDKSPTGGQEGDGFVPTQRNLQAKPMAFDWGTVDRRFTSYPHFLGKTSLGVGGILLWKELALNKATYSPEMMIHAGEVLELLASNEVRLRLFPRVLEEEEEVEEEMEEEVVRDVMALEECRLFA